MNLKKTFLLVAVLSAGALGGLHFSGHLAPLLWKLDDPAIQACRTDLIGQLKSPASYREIDAQLFTSVGNSVFITYDAANIYGTPVRDIHHCQWVYFKGKFLFKLPIMSGAQDWKISAYRSVTLRNRKLYEIDETSTDLKADEKDRAISICIENSLQENGLSRIADTYEFAAEISSESENGYQVEYRTHKNNSGMPKSAQCYIEKDKDTDDLRFAGKKAIYW
ncbi:hypothetical protein LP7551_05406 [Roseibium album]|nr:hypothetical protein LP7551_05406 [Roseibium album]